MDHKKSPMRRTKRQSKVLEENYWDCSVCTYRNNAEAFKCLMCDVRKGTSTRKPRLNSTLAAAQAAQNFPATSLPRPEGTNGTRTKDRTDKKLKIGKKRRHPPRLKNVDRSSAQTREVTVNSVTVVITEYKPKVAKSSEPSATSATSSASSDHGSLSESSDAKSMRNE